MKTLMTLTACLALGAFAAAGCGGDDNKDSSTSSSATTATTTTTTSTQQEAVPAVVNVSIVDNAYDPKDITIKRGQSIKWKNDGAVPHTVTSDDTSSVKFDSGTLNPKAVYALKPATAGKITYYCTIHGKVQSGTVTVER